MTAVIHTFPQHTWACDAFGIKIDQGRIQGGHWDMSPIWRRGRPPIPPGAHDGEASFWLLRP